MTLHVALSYQENDKVPVHESLSQWLKRSRGSDDKEIITDLFHYHLYGDWRSIHFGKLEQFCFNSTIQNNTFGRGFKNKGENGPKKVYNRTLYENYKS